MRHLGAQKEGDIQEQDRAVQVHVDACDGVTLLPVGATSPRQCHGLAHRCTVMGKLKQTGRDPIAATLSGWLMPCDPSL